jgi:Ca2+/Na+ antiporter
MAVSNAIGSNVFDINLGLGLPYLIKTIIKSGQPVLLLTPVELVAFRFGFYELVPHAKFGFILLLILIFAILLFMFVNFQLNRTVAVCLIVLYGLFLFYAFWQDIKCYKGRTC